MDFFNGLINSDSIVVIGTTPAFRAGVFWQSRAFDGTQ